MAFGDDWATYDTIYSGAPESSGDAWYDGVLNTVGGFATDVFDGADSWLGQLMEFEFQKEQLSYQKQLENQAAVLNTVESDQQTGNVPYSPNYRGIDQPAGTATGADNKMLLIAAGLVAVYLLTK